MDLRIVPVEDQAPQSVARLVIALPEGGLSVRDLRRCSRITGLQIDPETESDKFDPQQPIGWIPHGSSPLLQGAAAAAALVGDQPVSIFLPASPERDTRNFVLGLLRGSYRLKQSTTPPPSVTLLVSRPGLTPAAQQGAVLGRSVLLARDLANEPSNAKNPQWLADRALELADAQLEVTVWDDDQLSRRGFGGLSAVGAGSSSPPRLVRLTHPGPGPRVVLVGKGITFDSGGLSLKPPASMPLMKTDMTGAAAVLATMAAVRDLQLPLNVTGLLACAENMPSGSAMRPGDVVRQFGGRTTEVLNTDAEGRLVLADCLAYAAAELQPDYLVDIASLTGAATLGLGRQHAALFSDDKRLVQALLRAGAAGGDGVWHMPLVADYAAAISSEVADSANTNTDPHTSAGSITAALFLQPFAGRTRWAHLDIAGAARAEADRPDTRKGATGYGVSLLTNWLARLAGIRW